ncbi:MAG: glycosyltransferase family 2 protein [Planctomycetaceae bacterium]|jgi:cellulose synthase/poly-beta-1,6-N-acetylglucosamine synthase-like glycosyltransferase|nr:glycosyltransferase family 2 protein [Planctomycetaceae bacterium]
MVSYLLIIALSLFVMVLIVDVVNYSVLFIFFRQFRQQEWTTPQNDYVPKTLVCLALRGADPFLKQHVEGLLTQDYPDYTIRFIVDDQKDPALSVIREVIQRLDAKHTEITIVKEYFETCALKCNSLYRALQTVDLTYEVIAFLDADTNPHSQWLRQLVEPLSDSRFAATTGQRWFCPEKSNTGSIVRKLWMAACLVLFYSQRLIWGGSFAIRRETLFQSGIMEQWKTVLTEDIPLSMTLAKFGYKTAVIPDLIMVNRETCTLLSFYRWATRQTLYGKLYHTTWFLNIFIGIIGVVPILLGMILTFLGVANLVTENNVGNNYYIGNYYVVLLSMATILVYCGGAVGAAYFLEREIRIKLKKRNEQLPSWSFKNVIQTLLIIPVTQFVYLLTIFRLFFLDRVEWRGVEYAVQSDKSVRLIEYRPYRETSTTNTHSL